MSRRKRTGPRYYNVLSPDNLQRLNDFRRSLVASEKKNKAADVIENKVEPVRPPAFKETPAEEEEKLFDRLLLMRNGLDEFRRSTEVTELSEDILIDNLRILGVMDSSHERLVLGIVNAVRTRRTHFVMADQRLNRETGMEIVQSLSLEAGKYTVELRSGKTAGDEALETSLELALVVNGSIVVGSPWLNNIGSEVCVDGKSYPVTDYVIVVCHIYDLTDRSTEFAEALMANGSKVNYVALSNPSGKWLLVPGHRIHLLAEFASYGESK